MGIRFLIHAHPRTIVETVHLARKGKQLREFFGSHTNDSFDTAVRNMAIDPSKLSLTDFDNDAEIGLILMGIIYGADTHQRVRLAANSLAGMNQRQIVNFIVRPKLSELGLPEEAAVTIAKSITHIPWNCGLPRISVEAKEFGRMVDLFPLTPKQTTYMYYNSRLGGTSRFYSPSQLTKINPLHVKEGEISHLLFHAGLEEQNRILMWDIDRLRVVTRHLVIPSVEDLQAMLQKRIKLGIPIERAFSVWAAAEKIRSIHDVSTDGEVTLASGVSTAQVVLADEQKITTN